MVFECLNKLLPVRFILKYVLHDFSGGESELELSVIACLLRIAINHNQRVHQIFFQDHVLEENIFVNSILMFMLLWYIFLRNYMQYKVYELHSLVRIFNSTIQNDRN